MTAPDDKPAHGRYGNTNLRQITMAAVSTYPSEADPFDRILAVLAAAADERGKVYLSEDDVLKTARLGETRETRKAWSAAMDGYATVDGDGLVVLNTNRSFPVCLTSETGRVTVLGKITADIDHDDFERLDEWLMHSIEALRGRGLSPWQEPTVGNDLAAIAAATISAVEPERLEAQLAAAQQSLERFTKEMRRAKKKAEVRERRQQSLDETERAILDEIMAIEADIANTPDLTPEVAEATRLAKEVLAAAELLIP